MGNMFKIARKEFYDLSNDRIIFIVIGIFLLFILIDLYNIYGLMRTGFYDKDSNMFRGNPAINLGEMMLRQHMLMLSRYGGMLAIAMGFLSISDERHSGALNTLIVKPLYRDTIITGKMMGALGFLFCVFAIASAFLTSGLLIMCGDRITPIIGDYIVRVPFAIMIALLYSMIFFFLSMLISLIIRDYAFSFILSLLALSFSELITVYTFIGYIGSILGDEKGISNLIVSLSPNGMITIISDHELTDFTMNLAGCISLMEDDIIRMALYIIVLLLASYTIFLRRDIA